MGDGYVGQGLPSDDDLPDSPAGDGEDPSAGDDSADDASHSQADDGDEGAEGGQGEGEGDDPDLDLEGNDDGTGDEGASPTFDRIIKEKYKGDREAFAKAYLEQANSMSDLHGRVNSIEEFVRGQQEPQAVQLSQEEMKQRIAESSDVIEASEELASIEADITSEQDDYRKHIAEVGKTEKEVNRLTGKLEASYDEAKPQVSSELAAAQSRYERAVDRFKDSDRSLKKLRSNFERTKRRMDKAEKSAKAEIDRELKQQRGEAKDAQEVRTEFVNAMLSEAKDRKIDKNSKKFKILFDSVQSRLWAYTQTLSEDADPINIPAAVKVLTSEYFEEFGGQSFQNLSRSKRGQQQGKGNGSSPANRRTSKGGKEPVRDAAYWDRRAKRLLGG